MPIRPENLARYPANWAEISLGIRAARALGHCECEGECRAGHKGRCPARHNQLNPRTGSKVVLTVAHLDHTPENCDPANLKAMCQACHLSYDAEHHAATRARTKAAETGAWCTPLPGLEPAPATATPEPSADTEDQGAVEPHRPRSEYHVPLYGREGLRRGDWEQRALCRQVDTEMFFQGENFPAAKAVCVGCEVRPQCLAMALEVEWLYGVWGGTTPAERRTMRGRQPLGAVA